MSGWLIFALSAAAILGLLAWPGRIGRPALMLAASALFVAAAGYAWQGEPGIPGAPAVDRPATARGKTLFAIERQQFLNKFGETGTVLATADAFNGIGLDREAAGLLRNAVAKHPADPDLRIGYAHALLMQADGNLTPAVQLAFDEAEVIAPANPAPRYFLGLAHLESGDSAGAERIWRDLYASLPADSRWRAPLGARIAMFDMMRARHRL